MSSSEDLVSVIVPAFNAESTISETLASVSAQTHPALEIFVVDDGSTDETAALVEQHAVQEPRLTLLRQANAGVAAARNAGLQLASGRYAAWLDADDLWHPSKIATQVAVFSAAPHPLSFVYTGYRLIDAADTVLPNFRTLADISGETLCRQIATTYFTNVSSIMALTNLARACGGHDRQLRSEGVEGAEDLLLQLRLSMLAPASFCPGALVGYRMHSANMSRSIGRAARSNLRALALIEGEAPNVPGWVFRLGKGRMVGFALQMMQAGDVSGGFALLGHFIAVQPTETFSTLARIAAWMTRSSMGIRPADPAVGQKFTHADPSTVPVEGHMLLGKRDRQRLDAADLILPRDRGSRVICA